MSTEFEINKKKTRGLFSNIRELFEKAGSDIHGLRFRSTLTTDLIKKLGNDGMMSPEAAEDLIRVLRYNAGRRLEKKLGQPGFTQADIDSNTPDILGQRFSDFTFEGDSGNSQS